MSSEAAKKHNDIVTAGFDGRDKELIVTTPDGSLSVVQDRLLISFRQDDPATPQNEGMTDAAISAILYKHRMHPMGIDWSRGTTVSIRTQARFNAEQLAGLKTVLEGTPGVIKVRYVPSIEFVVPRRDKDKGIRSGGRTPRPSRIDGRW